MGQKLIHVDDLSGAETDQGRLIVHETTYKGTTYSVETTKANAAKLDSYIAGVLSGKHPVPGISGSKRRSPSTTIDTHGLDSKVVREWAIEQGLNQDGGTPVGKVGRISQGVYDAYRDAHKS